MSENNNKIFAVLQITPEKPTAEHKELFYKKNQCDFYFVTHDADHPDALKFCPNTTWAETRNTLVEMVPKNYEYYAFVDYDYQIESLTNKSIVEQICEDLIKMQPAVMAPYPGEGLGNGPLSNMKKSYKDSCDYSIWPFTHAGFVIVHHSLLDWFFPLEIKFDGGFSACHLFNILQIPFLKNIIVSHKFLYHNGVCGPKVSKAPHHNGKGQKNMDIMWNWLKPSLDIHDVSKFKKANDIKNYFIKICDEKRFVPEPNKSNDVNYYNKDLLNLFFNKKHEYFKDRL